MKLLLIEDDLKIASFLQKDLEEHGFGVTHCQSGEDGLLFTETYAFDLAIIDWMLPGQSGLETINEMRKRGLAIPIIVLSARAALKDKLEGYRHQIDDYVTKPFSVLELRAKIEAILRRARQDKRSSNIAFKEINLDLERNLCTLSNKPLELSFREFKLLRYFLENQNVILTKTMLLDYVWGLDYLPEANVVEVNVCRLRGKLQALSSQTYIHTVRGMGYLFK